MIKWPHSAASAPSLDAKREDPKRHGAKGHDAKTPETKALSQAEFRRIAELMYQRFGIDLRQGKEGLVAARLGKLLRRHGVSTFGQYLDQALADPGEEGLIEMVDALTTNHTSFLRELAHFDYLVKTIVPAHTAKRPLAIWSAACSTGEEPYSIACTLLDAARQLQFGIVATDLSTRVLRLAREGVYPEDRFHDFPPAWKQAFLTKATLGGDGAYRFRPEVVRRIDFRRLNLMEPFYGRYDLIFCRNVMMYFDRETQQSLVNRLAACLELGGHLYVGHSETLTGIAHGLQYVRPAIYRKAGGEPPRNRK